MRNIFFLLIISISIYSCGVKAKEKKQLMSIETVPVKLAPVIKDSSSSVIHASGILSTENQAKLSFKIGGVIESIQVKEGDFVKRGQLLATLVQTEISAQVQQVKLSVEKAERDYQRASNLYKDSVFTQEQLQNTRTSLDISKQNLQQVTFNQEYSRIYATADGFVVKQLSNAGELTSAGLPILITSDVSGLSKWILKIGVSDKQWAAIQIGNKGAVTIDAFPGENFDAVVSKKRLASDPVNGSFEIELQMNFGTHKPAIGMFGNVSISTSSSLIGYNIPYEALLEADGKKGFVFVTDDKKTVKKVPVNITSVNNNTVFITDGLKDDQYVIISGSPYLKDNSRISIQ